MAQRSRGGFFIRTILYFQARARMNRKPFYFLGPKAPPAAGSGYLRGRGREPGVLLEVRFDVHEDLEGYEGEEGGGGAFAAHPYGQEGPAEYGHMHQHYAGVGLHHDLVGLGGAVFAAFYVVQEERRAVACRERDYPPPDGPEVGEPEGGVHGVHRGGAEAGALQDEAEQEQAVHEHEEAEVEREEGREEELAADGQGGVGPAQGLLRGVVFRTFGEVPLRLGYGPARRQDLEYCIKTYNGRLAPVQREYLVHVPVAQAAHEQRQQVAGYDEVGGRAHQVFFTSSMKPSQRFSVSGLMVSADTPRKSRPYMS